jgi:hypothetical protein
VGDTEISFVENSASKKVCLQPDFVEYSLGNQAPMYILIIGMQTMHNLWVKLDLQEKTITIDKILLPMRNIANLQLKPRITMALRETPALLKSSLPPVAPPKAWWKFWMLSMRKQIFQP